MERVEERRHWSTILADVSFWVSFVGWIISILFPIMGDSYARDTESILVISLEFGALVMGVIAIIGMPDRSFRAKRVIPAVFGILLSILYLALEIHDDIAYPPGSKAKLTACSNNAKQLALGIMLYAGDHDDQLPPLDQWNEAIHKYIKSERLFICPGNGNNRSLPCYAMNGRLKGLRLRDVSDPANTVLLFESIPGKNLYGGPELYPKPSRHRYGYKDWYVVVFLDGRTTIRFDDNAKWLDWDPKKKPAKGAVGP